MADTPEKDEGAPAGGLRPEVARVIEAIRPAVQADNGDILLRDVEEDSGVVTVELIGACVSCPASTVTLKAGVERILKDRVPGITEVINAGETAEQVGGVVDSPIGGTGSGEPDEPVRETSVSL